MRLDPTETFAGVPARQVRDALRRHAREQVTPSLLAWTANCPEDSAEDLVAALVERGLVERFDEEWVGVTNDGLSFGHASLTTVTRKTADRVLGEFLDRVRALNADDGARFQVTEAVVFGRT